MFSQRTSNSDDTTVSAERHVPSGQQAKKWLLGLFWLCVLATCTEQLSLNRADPDLWGHVQYGRDVLTEGQIPATTTYSYTADGYRWINHENLPEVVFAVFEWCGGTTALLVLKFSLGLAVLTLMLRAMERQGVGVLARVALLLLVSYNLVFHWTMRPQLASYVCYAVMLSLLNWCFQGWHGRWHFSRQPVDLSYSSRRLKWLWALPLLFLVWANSHGGFVAGLAVLFAYLGGRSLEAFWVRGQLSWPLQRRIFLMATAAGLSTFINPYGASLQIWLLGSLGRPRPEIMEWLPPTFGDPMSLPYWLMLSFAVLTLIASRRSRDFTHLILLFATAWQALLHQRHASFFAITCGFYLGPHLHSIVQACLPTRIVPRIVTERTAVRWAVAVGLIAFLSVETYRIGKHLGEMPVHYDRFPCEAIQFMADHDLHGNLIVPYAWSQYVIASFGQEDGPVHVKVAFDGRYRTCYPQAIVDSYLDFAFGLDDVLTRFRDPNSPPYDPLRILNYAPPHERPADMVIVNTRQPHGVEVMQTVKDRWMKVFEDGLCQLWVRRAVFDQPESERYIPPSAIVSRTKPLDGSKPWPALPTFDRLQQKDALAKLTPVALSHSPLQGGGK
jgi:hypothetical protein